VIKDRIADSMFQQILIRADEYDVLATPNLNATICRMPRQRKSAVWGWLRAPTLGISSVCLKRLTVLAPKYADKDMVNPGSLLLSAVLMLEYMGWDEAARMIESGIEKTIQQKTVHV